MTSESDILHILFSILFLVFLFERGYFQSKAMRSSGELTKYREKKLSMALLILTFVVAQAWVIGSFIFIINPAFLAWTRLSLPPWTRWLGAVLAVTGMAVEFSTQLYLGRNYSTFLHVREEHSLITTGPYRYVRHPMYTALVTAGTGLSLLSASWYFGLPFIALIAVIMFRIKREERAMIEKFGDEYIQYMQRTGRFLPSIRKKTD
ncbi:MAG: isoprenylcysteine carboxylmethyltransferase family protein [Candidatus Odinarchaeota archaeon]